MGKDCLFCKFENGPEAVEAHEFPCNVCENYSHFEEYGKSPLPCPFCGSKYVRIMHDRKVLGHGDYYNRAQVHCLDCHAEGPSLTDYWGEIYTEAQVIAAWNKRV